ncbi:SLC13 family permease [Mycolicibacterium smegmatis]|uniref:Dicarboxylate carrier MatC domain protein n=3 Tax=Mycolicibacterium smegmatis TaxID=1772 RepID=I7G7E7_MYCS2|nr:SLC13 family permease [Mycolicibacterium smegmatis]ABK73416.1 dicarboxylate-carrier protein [Mycolicibacterium smegmatis MC2 155]AFP38589.1 Dicarboxylate carrier MatC domain protein [Mycolicibacterium smegmatis MC2 155]AIU07370.1 DeoR faimly transcriptional regulator [Mycolicibacterium smegmatis MC2 155]AIU13995.1 DeoR faimly transcriptional regulator [Mycolicibacterium smegmatis]AIU20618.1 DeoR faimly transcriptional regulator [Mycolicibacterium smegmatis]
MPLELIPILALIAMFAAATLLPINMGTLGFVAAFLVGTIAVGMDTDDIIAGFPSDLFLTLVGVTYLFAIAQNNGTVDLMVRGALRLVRGRVAFIPWVMFGITAVLTALGALGPAAVAIIAPIALTFARKYRINALLMGMMVIHGAQAGGFSPISIYGVTVNNIVAKAGLLNSPLALFLGSFFFNAAIGVLLFIFLGGRKLLGQTTASFEGDGAIEADGTGGPGGSTGGGGSAPSGGGSPVFSGHGTQASAATLTAPPNTPTSPLPRRAASFDQILTLIGLGALGLFSLILDLDVGFVAMTVAAVLALASPKAQKGAVSQISWSTVLLIGGVLTFVGVLQEAGTVEWVGNGVAKLGMPLLVALLLCYLGGIVSAFASSTAILGATIPLAVPLLLAGDIGPIGVVVALAIASTIVDVSPFSTNGALVLANAQGVDRDVFYRQILKYSGLVIAIGPLVAWAVLVLPGWL